MLRGNELNYVKECIDTEWVSSAGKFVELFEEKIAEFTGAKHAIACVNGTSALQLSLRLAGVKSGDEVIIPTLTFIAPVNAIFYNNALPVFMDADAYFNIDIEKTIDFIRDQTFFKDGYTYNKNTKNRISAILPVHVWGNAVSLDKLVPICEENNIAIIEDASESLGTFYKNGKLKGRHTGTIGRLGCISFNGNKIVTSGGGGMILTNNQKLANKARYLTTQAKDDPLYYIHNEIGYNFRLTNIQAALGLAQLEQLKIFLHSKREIFFQYKAGFKNIEGLTLANVPSYANNNHWMNLLQIESEVYGGDSKMLMQRLENNNIQTRPVWALNHFQAPYKHCQSYNIEKAIELVKISLCLPSSTNLNDNQLNRIIKQIQRES